VRKADAIVARAATTERSAIGFLNGRFSGGSDHDDQGGPFGGHLFCCRAFAAALVRSPEYVRAMPDRPLIYLRRATVGDEQAIIGLKQVLERARPMVDPHWRERQRADLGDEHGPFALGNHVLAIVAGEIAGSLCLSGLSPVKGDIAVPDASAEDTLLKGAPPSLFVSEMVVLRRLRRKGIATALLAFAEEAALKHRLPNLCLMVDAGNLPALALYRKVGFLPQASRPYRLPNEINPPGRAGRLNGTLILMVKPLISTQRRLSMPGIEAEETPVSAFLNDNPPTSRH